MHRPSITICPKPDRHKSSIIHRRCLSFKHQITENPYRGCRQKDENICSCQSDLVFPLSREARTWRVCLDKLPLNNHYPRRTWRWVWWRRGRVTTRHIRERFGLMSLDTAAECVLSNDRAARASRMTGSSRKVCHYTEGV